MHDFTHILLEARKRSVRDFGKPAELKFYRLYLTALNKALQRVNPEDVVSQQIAEELLKDVNRQTGLYGQAADIQTKRNIRQVIERTIKAHQAAFKQLTESEGINISVGFDGVSRETFENLFIRREMGLTSSYRSLSPAQIMQSGQQIEDALERLVLDGGSWQSATQEIIDGLTLGDSEIRRMAKSMARKSKGLGNWIRPDSTPREIESIKQARKIAYDARRIARTEPAHAHHEADRVTSMRSPVVKALKWNLSHRHPEPDICDVYTKIDLHGLGEGVYPAEYLPKLPHPHCLCFMTHVLWEPGEWRKPHPPFQEPAFVTDNDVRRILPNASKRAVFRTRRQINEFSELMLAADEA